MFPGFDFEIGGNKSCTEVGYLCWHDIHKIYDKDQQLSANLRKAPKLSHQALHPSDKNQNINLALGLFCETRFVACRCYFPQRDAMANFLQLFSTWWTILINQVKFDANPPGNAVTADDGKIYFFGEASILCRWVETVSKLLSYQTESFAQWRLPVYYHWKASKWSNLEQVLAVSPNEWMQVSGKPTWSPYLRADPCFPINIEKRDWYLEQ